MGVYREEVVTHLAFLPIRRNIRIKLIGNSLSDHSLGHFTFSVERLFLTEKSKAYLKTIVFYKKYVRFR